MRTHRMALLLVVMVFLAALTAPLMAQDIAREEEIVKALGAALNEGDVDLAMTYMADNAYFATFDVEAGEPLRGKEEIRALYEELVAGAFRIETNIVATYGDGSVLVSETQTWADWMIEMELAPFNATEVYVVKNDQIIGITWIMSQETQARVLAAMAPPPADGD